MPLPLPLPVLPAPERIPARFSFPAATAAARACAWTRAPGSSTGSVPVSAQWPGLQRSGEPTVSGGDVASAANAAGDAPSERAVSASVCVGDVVSAYRGRPPALAVLSLSCAVWLLAGDGLALLPPAAPVLAGE